MATVQLPQSVRAAFRPPPQIALSSRPDASLSRRVAIAPTSRCAFAQLPSFRLASRHVQQSRRRNARDGADQRSAVIVSSVAEEERGLDAGGDEDLSGDEWAHMSASWSDTVELAEMEKPLAEYMTLPASQYSVLDAERIERVDANTFRCYAQCLKFFTVEIRPVLLVRVEEEADGCTIRLISATLDGSPIIVKQNKKFRASMVNRVRWTPNPADPSTCLIMSETTLKSSVAIPSAFRIIPRDAIQSSGNKLLQQVLRVAVPRFLAQLKKDYFAWASGDSSRKPLGTGEL